MSVRTLMREVAELTERVEYLEKEYMAHLGKTIAKALEDIAPKAQVVEGTGTGRRVRNAM